MLKTEVFNGPELFQKLKASWQTLALESAMATPFQTWEWQSTWWKYFGRSKQARAVAIYEGDDLVGLMPLVRTVGAWRVLRSMGIGPSDYLHPLVRTGLEEAVAERLSEYLATVSDADIVDLHQIREVQPLAHQPQVQKNLEQATCLVLDLPETYDLYLTTLGKSLRYDVRKLDKTLFHSGQARIDELPRDRVQEGFEVFLEQHRARWRKRHLPGAFLGRTVSFHRDWIEQAADNGWLKMSLLKVDGEPIGAIYAMSFGQTVYYYQAGFNPEKASVSPGTLLVAWTIRAAIEDGKTRFDFMRGDEPYKRRWKPQHEWRNQRLLIAKENARGRFGASWNEFGSGVEKKVRERLEGRGLV